MQASELRSFGGLCHTSACLVLIRRSIMRCESPRLAAPPERQNGRPALAIGRPTASNSWTEYKLSVSRSHAAPPFDRRIPTSSWVRHEAQHREAELQDR